MLATKFEANQDATCMIRSSSCVGEDRRKGRRKERGKKRERQRKTERDSDKKDIGKDKREWKSMEV